MEKIKELEEKISAIVERVKSLKHDRDVLQRKADESGSVLAAKDQEIATLKNELYAKNTEIERMLGERNSVAEQIEAILSELDKIEI
ncbi:hypothetical protein MBAV_002405 [Candidatus Magnetobacterium bavaricum]|uniref:Cell division protein ZapB n=1 Tax=Candidatus Magnetobacterium bavaricum TaxID=29290 RepID=A0A0F3GXJ3_9BACT|nr:hypothetical protein MBAV_002405 [Candidatus Magnetobacterium bavaricum]